MTTDKNTGATPEADKMIDRLMNGPVMPDGSRPKDYRLINFNAWWGPDAQTSEQRAAAVNRVLEMHDRGELKTILPGEIDGSAETHG